MDDRVESPTAVACRSCFSVRAVTSSVTSSILSKVPNRLPWRRDGPTERSFCDFCDVMLGSSWKQNSDEMLSVNQSICLEELSFDQLKQLFSRLTHGEAFALHLQPYLEDLLIRRQGFRGFVDVIASVADADASVPQILSELTAKDLFIALLLLTPSRRKRIRLATAYLSLKVPLPLIFRYPEWTNGVCKARTLAGFELLQEIACVPRPGRTVIVSLGTDHVSACGKTTLLGAMGLTSCAPEDLDVRPSGPMHGCSCDLFQSNDELWLLDVHGALDGDVRSAVLAFNLWANAIALLHCSAHDFHATGPRKELAAVLNDLCHHVTVSNQQLKGNGIIVLIRDLTEEAFGLRRNSIEAGLAQYNVIATFAVEDCRNFRSATRRATAMERLRVRLEDCYQKSLAQGRGTLCLEDLQRVHNLVEGRRSDPKLSRVLGMSTLGRDLTNLLERAQKGSLFESLFPLTSIRRPHGSAMQHKRNGNR